MYLIQFLGTSEYERNVRYFVPTDIKEVRAKIQEGDDFLLYLGRESCPDCEDFVPTLNQVAKTLRIPVYYMDSTGTKEHKELKAFREEYDVESVPTLLIFQKGRGEKPNLPKTEEGLEELLAGYHFENEFDERKGQ